MTADGGVYFTDALAESYPPSADLSRSLQVAGIDVTTVSGLQTAEGITWTEQTIQLVGTVSGSTLTVAEGVSG